MSLTPEPAGVAQGALFPAGRLDAARVCYRVMSCYVQTFSRSASNPNSATASRDFAMNGTSTSAPGLVTSSRQHSTVICRPTSRRRRDDPSPAGNPASSGTARAPRSTDPGSPRSRRTRAAPLSASPTAGAAPGRLRDVRGRRGRSAQIHRGGLQHPQTALSARLPEPRTIRGSTHTAPCQNRGLTLSTHRGALQFSLFSPCSAGASPISVQRAVSPRTASRRASLRTLRAVVPIA